MCCSKLCSPGSRHERINEKMRKQQMVLQRFFLHYPLPQAVSIHAKPWGPTWQQYNYPKCTLMFHYTLTVTMCADYKYQPLSFSYTSAVVWHSTVKMQHSRHFQNKAHADKQQWANYLSLCRVPVGFDKDDITPIFPVTMTLTRTSNQQASVLALAGATLFMLQVSQHQFPARVQNYFFHHTAKKLASIWHCSCCCYFYRCFH